ncbi:hypothetical protein BHE74_00053934 [Ensete ventricosum]|uniref:Uncharacterized protein n=1 Tax=Ensete ventricosum TaxID=4639 RepID=A0A444CVT8_ENSVE|nr:hypothetical protein B296_00014777 [Ensete ventricosum]RWV90023.1 hypothetical protein GW17_00047803 [Ensete ventricosum]RWW40637.1 hypothetical protein BHE74_00053934 [Ensete ventricosum]RZS12640.1 hypothetical protein BHM03_00044118 [Ensete ventricosum]
MDVHVTPWRPCLACDAAIAKEYTRGKETSRFLIECNVGGGDKSHCSLSHATPIQRLGSPARRERLSPGRKVLIAVSPDNGEGEHEYSVKHLICTDVGEAFFMQF